MSETLVAEIVFASDKSIEVLVEDGMAVLRVIDIEVEITTKMQPETAARLATHLSTAAIIAPHPYAIENMVRAKR